MDLSPDSLTLLENGRYLLPEKYTETFLFARPLTRERVPELLVRGYKPSIPSVPELPWSAQVWSSLGAPDPFSRAQKIQQWRRDHASLNLYHLSTNLTLESDAQVDTKGCWLHPDGTVYGAPSTHRHPELVTVQGGTLEHVQQKT